MGSVVTLDVTAGISTGGSITEEVTTLLDFTSTLLFLLEQLHKLKTIEPLVKKAKDLLYNLQLIIPLQIIKSIIQQNNKKIKYLKNKINYHT